MSISFFLKDRIKVIEESFVNGDSVIHCLDVRVKIIMAGVFSIIVTVSDRFGALIPAIIFAMSIAISAIRGCSSHFHFKKNRTTFPTW